MAADKRKAVIEALLFASSKPLSIEDISEASGLEKAGIRKVLTALQEEYAPEQRGFSLEEVAGGFQLRSDPRFSAQIGKLFASRSRRRMTRSSLESLSIIAYKQPVTRAEIEYIRGVDSGAVLKTLLSLSMIRILGRKDAPGRPILYGTTREFLEYFGLRDIESLPTLEEVTELLEESEDAMEQLDAETGGGGDAEREDQPDAEKGGGGDAEREDQPDTETGGLGDTEGEENLDTEIRGNQDAERED